MCDPVTGTILVGSALKAAGSISSGEANKQAAYDQANQVEADARAHAAVIRRQARATRGAARADLAASGVLLDEGTPNIIDQHIVYNSELDALNALASGNRQADSLRRTGRASQTAGYLSGAGDLASGWGIAAKG